MFKCHFILVMFLLKAKLKMVMDQGAFENESCYYLHKKDVHFHYRKFYSVYYILKNCNSCGFHIL